MPSPESSADPLEMMRRLEAHETRLAARLTSLEKQVNELQVSLNYEVAERRRRRMSLVERFRRKFLQPMLWKWQQYPPRALRTPSFYETEPLQSAAPRIAIVTPSYNHGRFIKETIDSVLTQNYPNLDYLVQDGGSTDETVRILKEYGDRLKWRSEVDKGQGDAINKGFTTVNGDIMGYLNSDDTLLPGSLAFVANAFARHPDIDVVYGHRVYIDVDGYDIGRSILPNHDAEAIKWADYIPQETMFWRRKVWDAVKPFDDSFRFALDWDFILRAQAAGFKFKRLPRFLACFRVHSAQKTSAMRDVGDNEMAKLRLAHLGKTPSTIEIGAHIKGYLMRQMLTHWRYQLGLLRH